MSLQRLSHTQQAPTTPQAGIAPVPALASGPLGGQSVSAPAAACHAPQEVCPGRGQGLGGPFPPPQPEDRPQLLMLFLGDDPWPAAWKGLPATSAPAVLGL